MDTCPFQCQQAKPYQMEVSEKLKSLKFKCANYQGGCEAILSYDEVISHAEKCRYGLIECPAYRDCLTKVNSNDIHLHEKACAYIKVECKNCQAQFMRKEELKHLEQC